MKLLVAIRVAKFEKPVPYKFVSKLLQEFLKQEKFAIPQLTQIQAPGRDI